MVPVMSRSFFFTIAILFFTRPIANAGEWEVLDTTGNFTGEPLQYVKKVVQKKGETASFFSKKSIHLAVFDSRHFDLKVIDNGSADKAAYPDVTTAMQRNFCPAGVNGGFFLKSYAPSGLQIADGKRTGKFGTAKLLSGVISSDAKGNIQLLRRAEFKDGPGIQNLLQAGPFLVDKGTTVAGLSNESPRRRTFVLTDGKGKWALGLCDSLTLAELSKVLAMPDLLPGIEITRALNLDGGTSSGFYFDTGAGNPDVYISPIKRVRNFVGISPR